MFDDRSERRGMTHTIAVLAIIVLGYLLFLVVRPFLTPLVFAAVMVVVFEPLHARLERRLSPSAAGAISTLAVVLVIIVPAVLIAGRIVNETIDLAGNIRTLSFDVLMARAQSHAARWGVDLEQVLRNGAQQLAGRVGLFASRVFTNTWALFIGVVVAILAMFFMFRDGQRLLHVVVSAAPMPTARTRSLVDDLGGLIRSNIAASLLAASIQGTLGGLAFTWFGLPAPVLWGAVMGVLCVFPFVGAWLVWAPAAAVLAISNRLWDAVFLVVIGLAVVHPVDNLLRPAIVAHSTKLNGLLVLIGLLGGVQAFGASGLVLGPMLISIAAGLLAHPASDSSVTS